MSTPTGRPADATASATPPPDPSDYLARRLREKAEERERDEQEREDRERRYLAPLRAIRPEWDVAWSEVMIRLRPVWQPWTDSSYAGGEPDIPAVAASLKRVAASIVLRDAVPEWRPSWLTPHPPGASRDPDTLRGRLAWVADFADDFTTEAPVAAAALVSFALDHPADAVADRFRVVLADPDWRPAVGWLYFVGACLWPRDSSGGLPQPLHDPAWPDGKGVYVLDCRRLEHLLSPSLFNPTPENLFPRWHCRMADTLTRAAAPSEPEPTVRSVVAVEPREVTQAEPEPSDERPPGWAALGDARRAILTVLAKETVRRDGLWVAGKAGYKHGTLRHHFRPLQDCNYIDRTKDGYAITPGGRALIPPKAV